MILATTNLIDKLRKAENLTTPKADRIVHLIFDEIAGALRRGEKYQITEFGVFEVRKNKPGMRKNLKAGTTFYIKGSNRPHIRFSKILKKYINDPDYLRE